MNKIIHSGLTFLISLSLASAYAQKDWEFQKEKDGVKIYKRSSGNGHEIKLVSNFQCTQGALVSLFNNISEYPKWGYKVAHSELLKRVSDTEFYYYSRFDFPWPLDDRDVVMHTTITKDDATNIITLTSNAAPDYIPEKPNLVRVRKADVSWTLIAQGENATEGAYCLSTDPGGLLPEWTVSLASDTGPVETVKNMKKLLSEERYKNVKLVVAH